MVRLFSQIENSKEELLTPTEAVSDENEEFIENEEETNSDTSDSDDDTADIDHVDEEIGQELENLKLMEFKDNEETLRKPDLFASSVLPLSPLVSLDFVSSLFLGEGFLKQ